MILSDIEILTSNMFISIDELIDIPAAKLKEIINKELSFKIADVLMKEIDNLPVVYSKETDSNSGGEVHRLRLNIISNEELKRLRTIERDYNDMMSSSLNKDKIKTIYCRNCGKEYQVTSNELNFKCSCNNKDNFRL